jgi:phytoene dehydrogenase-like protein
LTTAQQPEYDAIIIGAGISGLTAAALLSRAGKKVFVVEMDTRPGGYLAGFRRLDYRFDSAIHWLNQLGPNGLVTRMFDLIGSDHPIAIQQHRIKRYLSDKHDYLLTSDPELMKAAMIRDFPHEKEGIEKFFAAAHTIGRSFSVLGTISRADETMNLFQRIALGLRKFKFVIPFIQYVFYAGDAGVKKGLSKFFKDPGLHAIFASEQDLLSCLVPIGWAYFGDYQRPPVGGSQVFPEWLAHVVTSCGSTISYRSKVSEVIVENGAAKGVRFQVKGKPEPSEVRGKEVIACCDVEALYERMLPPDAIPQKLKDSLRNAKLYSSSLTVSLALDCTAEALGFGEEMVYLAQSGLTREDHSSGDPHKTDISILAPSLRDKTLAPEGCGTLTLYIPAFFAQEDNWRTEVNAKGDLVRGEAYKQVKQEYADILIDRVEKLLAPGLRQHIVYCDIATPITHWRYSGNREGTMMGARPGKENMQAKVAHYNTPVKHLTLGGHWAELGGGVPVAVKAASNAALIVLQRLDPARAQLLADYMDGKNDRTAIDASGLFTLYADDWVQSPTPAVAKAARLADSEAE